MSFQNFHSLETTIFIGNGFDLSLGLRTRYTDFFADKNFWPTQESISSNDGLYNALNKLKAGEDYLWYDLENELKNYAKRSLSDGTNNSLHLNETAESDQRYFEKIKNGFISYLKNEVNNWRSGNHMFAHKSPAYQLMLSLCDTCKIEPNVISFNYTDVYGLLQKCMTSPLDSFNLNRNKIHQIHGSLSDEHIILGINEDKDIPQVYHFLFKSWDSHYHSHQIIDTLKSSQAIFFFGLSFGSIDSVYFVNFFLSIIRGEYDTHKKLIVICTYDETSLMEIYNQLLIMGISIMELKAHSNFNVLLTNPINHEHNLKFSRGKILEFLERFKDD